MQYIGIIQEEQIRGVLEHYLDDRMMSLEDMDILRSFANDVGLVILDEGYYPRAKWGWNYFLACPFEVEEEATLTMLAADQLKIDFTQYQRKQPPQKQKIKFIS